MNENRMGNRIRGLLAGVLLLGLGSATQAAPIVVPPDFVVSDGFELGAGIFDSSTVSGTFEISAGTYDLNLTAFTFGPAGPFIFGISNLAEAFQVSVASFGSASERFTTLGGTFGFLVGGDAAAGAIYEASISAIPLPPAVWMLGSALVGLVTVGRRSFPS